MKSVVNSVAVPVAKPVWSLRSRGVRAGVSLLGACLGVLAACRSSDAGDAVVVGSAGTAVAATDDVASRAAAYLAAVRKEAVGRFTVKEGKLNWSVPDPGKHTWQFIFASLAEDPTGGRLLPGTTLSARAMAEELVRFPDVFHFNADGPALMVSRYPSLVPTDAWEFFFTGHPKSALARTVERNYNLFTGEGTENHLAMSRVPGYLLAQAYLKWHPNDPRATAALGQAREYILRHTALVLDRGTGEWNSSTYFGYQLRSLLTCHDLADDPEIRKAVRDLLDALVMDWGFRSYRGVNAFPESRGVTWAAGDSEMAGMMWLWTGEGQMPAHSDNTVYAAISSYRPPAALGELVRKQGWAGREYFGGPTSYLLDRRAETRESAYFGEGFALSCMYGGGAGMTGASTQFTPAKIVVQDPRVAGGMRVFVPNSDGLTRLGQGRSPWDQWGVSRNVMVHVAYVPPDAAGLLETAKGVTEAWRVRWASDFAQRFDRPVASVGAHVTTPDVRFKDVSAYLCFSGGDAGVTWGPGQASVAIDAGRATLVVHSVSGRPMRLAGDFGSGGKSKSAGLRWLVGELDERGVGGVVVEVLPAGAGADVQAALGRRVELEMSDGGPVVAFVDGEGRHVRFAYGTTAAAPLREPAFDWTYFAEGETNRPLVMPTMPPLAQPTYPPAGMSLRGWGRVPTFTVDDKPVGGAAFLDLKAEIPVIDGPGMRWDRGVMHIGDGDSKLELPRASVPPATASTVTP